METTTNDMVTLVDRGAIRPSAVNPRKRFDLDKLNDLAASIEAQGGIIYPLLVRPIPQEGDVLFELVAGERRWRASEMAGLKEVPCMIRQLSDREAAELQLVENLQREDLTPVEEARGLSDLLRLYDGDTKAVANKIGRHETHVRNRIRILGMPQKALDAIEGGTLSVTHAEVISRVPSIEKQGEIFEEVLEEQSYGNSMTVEQLEGIVRNRYMVELRGAPFSAKDPDLVPEAGPCCDCPKRHQSGKALLCTDPECFNRKRDAAFAIATAKAEESGMPVLSAKDSEKIFHNGSVDFRPDSQYVLAAAQPQNHEVRDDLKRVPSWKKLAGEHGVPIALARDGKGRPVEVVDRNLIIEAERAATAAAKEKSIFKDRADSPYNADYKAEQKRAREKAKKDLACGKAVLGALVDRIEKRKPVSAFWSLMLGIAIEHAGHDAFWMVAKRRGIEDKDLTKGIQKLADGLEDDKARIGLAVELLLAQGVKWSGTRFPLVQIWCDAYDIDLKKVEKEALALLKGSKA